MRKVTERTTSRYECSRAAQSDWDLYSWTKAYSPRNEAYVYANNFVDLWREVVGTEITPYSKFGVEFYHHRLPGSQQKGCHPLSLPFILNAEHFCRP